MLSNVDLQNEEWSALVLCSLKSFVVSVLPQMSNHFFPSCVCKGSRSLPGGGRNHAEGVLQRHRGGQRRGPVLEEGHLQGHLQIGQRGPRDLQVSQLSPRASTRVNVSSPPPPRSTLCAFLSSDFIEFQDDILICFFSFSPTILLISCFVFFFIFERMKVMKYEVAFPI